MSLCEVEGSAPGSWDRQLEGTLERLLVDSELLAENPLGDPTRRELYVYVPPRRNRPLQALPTVYLLQGFAGELGEWLTPFGSEPTLIEQLDGMFANGDCPPALIVFVDAWTSCGTSQFLNSAGTGRYLDYLCDEIVPFVDARFPARAQRDGRAVAGNSSGGYGALVAAMLRPDVFSALASHAGDALFECCYEPLFPRAARELRERFDGSLRAFQEAISIENWRESPLLFATCGTGLAYTPDPECPAGVRLPFDTATGRTIEDVWERWLAFDPVRMADAHADTLRSMRRIYLDAGREDDFFLDLGAQALSRELSRLGIDHTAELFDGGHDIPIPRRCDAVRELVLALE